MLECSKLGIMIPKTGATDFQKSKVSEQIKWMREYSESLVLMVPVFWPRDWRDIREFVPQWVSIKSRDPGISVVWERFSQSQQGYAAAVAWLAQATEIYALPDKHAVALGHNRTLDLHLQIIRNGVGAHRCRVFPAHPG